MKTTEYFKARWELWQQRHKEHVNIDYRDMARMAELLESAQIALKEEWKYSPNKNVCDWLAAFEKFQHGEENG